MDLLLIHPPAIKPAEPPLGMSILAGALESQGISYRLIDANIEAYRYLLEADRLNSAAGSAPSTAVYRALRHVERSLKQVCSPAILTSQQRYRTCIGHLNRALSVYSPQTQEQRFSLGDYTHGEHSEFSPEDLEAFAEGRHSTLFSAYFRESLLPRVKPLQPRCIALSINYRHQAFAAFELAGMLRRALPEVKIIAGGGLLSSWKQILRRMDLSFSVFSHVVFGPGEKVLAPLARGEMPRAPYFIDGGPEVAFVPSFRDLPLADYLSPVPVLPVSASRGCYWRRCLFCPEAAAPTHPFRAYPGDSFPELLRQLQQRYKVRHFHLTDNAIPLPVLRSMAKKAEALQGLFWYGFVRLEKALLDEEFAFALARSGCRMLQLGVESGSQQVLDRLCKGNRVEEAGTILRLLKRAGIATYVYMMLGTPGERQEDGQLTLRFLEEHAEAIDYLNLAIMNLPRDSVMAEEGERFGITAAPLLAEEKPLGLYRSFEPAQGWERSEARRFLHKDILSSSLIRPIVQRTPALFTSDHAFLFESQAD